MNIISVNSFKGGTAKTSTTLHLGAALARYHQKKVLLIDFDAQANLTSGLGFDPDEYDSLAPILQDLKKIEAVIQQTHIENLDLVPADTWLERVEVTGCLAADRYSHEKLKHLLNPLDYDFILIDTPPSLCWLTESAMIAAHYSLICVTPEFYSIKGLERLGQFINSISQRHPLKVAGVALSFWNPRGKNNHSFIELIEETFSGKIFSSKIRRDSAITEASIYGKPIFEIAPSSRAAQDYLALTEELLTCLDYVKTNNDLTTTILEKREA